MCSPRRSIRERRKASRSSRVSSSAHLGHAALVDREVRRLRRAEPIREVPRLGALTATELLLPEEGRGAVDTVGRHVDARLARHEGHLGYLPVLALVPEEDPGLSRRRHRTEPTDRRGPGSKAGSKDPPVRPGARITAVQRVGAEGLEPPTFALSGRSRTAGQGPERDERVSHASFVVPWCGTGSLCRCCAGSAPFAFQTPLMPLRVVSEGGELRNATQSEESGLGLPGSRTNSRSGGTSSDPSSSHPSDEHTLDEWAGQHPAALLAISFTTQGLPA